jgi:endo-1,4-beta-xylanase
MRDPLNLAFNAALGIILIPFMGCSGSRSGLGLNAGAAAGALASGTGGSDLVDAGDMTRTGGEIGTGGFASAGGNTGSVTPSVIAGAPAGGAGGTGGTMSNPGGSLTIGSTAAGGTSTNPGGSTAGGTTAVGGTSLSTSTGGTGGASAVGGVTASAGSRSAPSFPARFVGNIDTRRTIPTDFSKYWDQFTPETAGRWTAVQSVGKDTFNWTALDAMYKYTEENNIIFKEHCFVWGSSEGGWIKQVDVMEAARTWMKTFCDRYPNTRLIDVVNEPPPHTSPGYAMGLGGGTNTTWDWVANSFKLAREACPNAILLLNDYNNCEYASDNQNTIKIVKAIQALDAPIDAVGCQAHDAAKVKLATFKNFMEKITSETGLPVYITEFDIGLADDEQQRAQYADYFTMFWDSPNVKGVTVWGYITGMTWRNNTGIMSSEGTMRPAMTWLMDFLKR